MNDKGKTEVKTDLWKEFILPFTFRFLWAIITFLTGLIVLVAAICVLDRFDIVRRSLLYFKPFASSLPWVILTVFSTVLLCIPHVTTELKRLLDRVEKIGNLIQFRPEQDEETRLEAAREVEEDLVLDSHSAEPGKKEDSKPDPPRLEPQELMLVLTRKIREIRQRKRLIMQLHGGRIQSRLTNFNIGFAGTDLQFDAQYENGRVVILAKVFSIPAPNIASFCENWRLFKQQACAKKVVLHLLLYFRKTVTSTVREKQLSDIRAIVEKREDVQVFLYSVTEDNSVKPLEELS